MADRSETPTLNYFHVYTDADGTSTQRRCELTGFEKQSMGGKADPQWNKNLLQGEVNILTSELPANWTGDWHENPHPQWIIPLSGGWWVETQDGKRVEMRAGELSFGADQGTFDDADGNEGHRSGSLDGEPCRMMIVQLLDKKFVGAGPEKLLDLLGGSV